MITLLTIAILTQSPDTCNRNLIFNIPKVTSVRYHALRAWDARPPVLFLAPTNTNTIGCETVKGDE